VGAGNNQNRWAGIIMPLKYKVTNLEEVEENHRELYAEKEEAGKKVFILQVEGAVDRERLNEFRDNNIALRKEKEDLQTQWEGIDLSPEQVKELVAMQDKIRASKAKGNEEIESEVNARTERLKKEYEVKLQKMQEQNAALNSGLTDLTINQAAISAATKRGLRPSAIPDLTSRARVIFKLVDGKPKALEADGKTPKYGKDATELTIDEWAEELTAEAPHLFEKSSGSGAPGSGSGGAGGSAGIRNPWKKESYNLTEQMKITKKDPKAAARLKAEAGK
jgi:hypothetical protein